MTGAVSLRARLDRASATNARALRDRFIAAGLLVATDPLQALLQPRVCASCGRPDAAPELAQPAHTSTSEG